MSDDLKRAELLFDMKRYVDADEHLSSALSTRPDDVDAMLLLARTRAALDDERSAVELASRAVATDPHNPTAHAFLSMHLRALKRWDESLASGLESLRLEPNHWWFHYNVAMTCMYKGRSEPRKALEHINRAIELDPFQSAAHNLAGVALDEIRRPAEAITAYEEALRLDPQSTTAMANLAGSRAAARRLGAGLELIRSGFGVDAQSEAVRERYQAMLYQLMRRFFWIEISFGIPLGILVGTAVPWIVRAVLGTIPLGIIVFGLWRFRRILPRSGHIHMWEMMRSARGWALWGVVLFWLVTAVFLALAYAPLGVAQAAGILLLLFLRGAAVVVIIAGLIGAVKSLFSRSD